MSQPIICEHGRQKAICGQCFPTFQTPTSTPTVASILTPAEEAKIEEALRTIWGRMYSPPEREGRYKTLDEEAEILRSLVLDIKRAERERAVTAACPFFCGGVLPGFGPATRDERGRWWHRQVSGDEMWRCHAAAIYDAIERAKEEA